MFSRIMESLRTRLANAWTALVGPQENIHDWIKKQPPKMEEPLPTGGPSIQIPISPYLQDESQASSLWMSISEIMASIRSPGLKSAFPYFAPPPQNQEAEGSISISSIPEGLRSEIESVSGPALTSRLTVGSLPHLHLGICQDLPMSGERLTTQTECSQPLSQDGFLVTSKPERTSELSEK